MSGGDCAVPPLYWGGAEYYGVNFVLTCRGVDGQIPEASLNVATSPPNAIHWDDLGGGYVAARRECDTSAPRRTPPDRTVDPAPADRFVLGVSPERRVLRCGRRASDVDDEELASLARRLRMALTMAGSIGSTDAQVSAALADAREVADDLEAMVGRHEGMDLQTVLGVNRG